MSSALGTVAGVYDDVFTMGQGSVLDLGAGALGGGKGGGLFADKIGAEGLYDPHVSNGQLDTAYNNTQTGLAQQQAFLQALQGQNGIQNQNAAMQGYQNLAAGTGPNPAQAQLAQATQANVANQASMAAGQRGASQNVGMIARGAANQGANAQQQAAGQAATLGAQQQVQGLQGMAGISGQQVNNLGAANLNYSQAAQGEQGQLQGARSAYNTAQAGLYGSQNAANASVEMANAKAKQGMFGGLLNGLSSGSFSFADGGKVPDTGSSASPSTPIQAYFTGGATQTDPFGAPLQNQDQYKPMQSDIIQDSSGKDSGGMDMGSLIGLAAMLAKGGKVPALVSPDEGYLTPSKAKEVAAGKKSVRQAAEVIPGKAKVKGDSLKNDTVSKNLDAGGVVIPRTKMKDEDSAAKFVQAIMFHSHGGKKK